MADIEWLVCDDCRQAYAGPAFYSFDADGCEWSSDGGLKIIAHECTENLCPECAGPYLEPDNESDPRRVLASTDEILDMLARKEHQQ